jgi:hypothetical protein
MVEAKIIDNMIVCGKCGHKIAGCKEVKLQLGNGEIYLLCKHRDGSKPTKERNCMTMNKVSL